MFDGLLDLFVDYGFGFFYKAIVKVMAFDLAEVDYDAINAMDFISIA